MVWVIECYVDMPAILKPTAAYLVCMGVCVSRCLIWCLYVSLIGAVLAAVLRSHGEATTAVAEQGLAAIANLSAGNAVSNVARLGEAGACEGVWIVLAWCVLFVFVSVVFHRAE